MPTAPDSGQPEPKRLSGDKIAAKSSSGPTRRANGPGPLVIVGGAEDKVGRSTVLRRFVREAGGKGRARILVVPTASSVQPEMIAMYTDVFTRLGAVEVTSVRPMSRREADDPALAAATAAATGIYLTGGNQVKLSQIVTGTALGNAIHNAHDRGVVVGGTSAGASIMSNHMIALGPEGITPRQGASQVSAGLGLLDGVIIDQHFDQRGRYGRLMSVVAASPSLLGIGIDENTAIVVTERRWVEVIGAGGVFVIDGQYVISSAFATRRGGPLLFSGATVHTLPAGARFDLQERRLVDFTEMHPERPANMPHTDRDEAKRLSASLLASIHRHEDL